MRNQLVRGSFNVVTTVTALLAATVASSAVAQDTTAVERPGFRPMRYDENWRPLGDAEKHTEPLDALKWIELSETVSVTLGSEARLRFEDYDKIDLGLNKAAKSDYLLARLMVHADIRAGANLRGFVQLRIGDAWQADRPLSPVQVNDIDVNQAFFDVTSPVMEGDVGIRLGRQEMLFGSGRMVAPRDGPNVRLSFDGGRLFWAKQNGQRIDVFYTRPVLPRADSFDDKSTKDYEFWGGYATTPILPGIGFDLYYFGLDRSRVAFGQEANSEVRHTLGGRFFGRAGRWDWDSEIAYQFGDFGNQSIRAFAFANDFGYTLKTVAWSPRVGLRLNLASGDKNLSDGRLGTFEVPFPKLPYLIEPNFIGPANIIDVHPTLTLNPRRNVRLSFDYIAVWKHRRADVFYLPPLRPVAGTADTGRFVANVVQMGARWDVTPQLSFDFLYAHAYIGNDLKRSGGQDSDFVLFAATTKF